MKNRRIIPEEQLRQRAREHAARLRDGDDPVEFWASFCAEVLAGNTGFASAEDVDCPPDPQVPRLYTLFLSLRTPVLLLNSDFQVEVMNPAAVELTGAEDCGDWCRGGHAPVPLADLAPWLESALDAESLGRGAGTCKLDVPVAQGHGERHFNVSVSLTADFSDRYDGYAVVLDDITARVEGARELARERNRVAHYLDVVGAMVFTLDAAGKIDMVNRTACRVLGYTEADLLGRDWVNALVPPFDRDEIRDCLCLVLSGQMAEGDERIFRVNTREGAYRTVMWQSKLLTTEGGLPVGMLLSGTDITEQRAIEEALAEKELWLRSTFVGLGEAVLILTPDMEILDANPAAESMFQKTQAELAGLPVGELHVSAGHYDDFLARSRAAFEAEGRTLFELPLKRRNGEIFPADQSVSLIKGDDGATLGVVNVIRDISDRKHAEAELKRSEEKFRRIFETIEEGYMVTDLEGTVLMVNPATCRLLCYEESELVGCNLDTLYRRTDGVESLRDILRQKGAIRGQQMTARRKDGSAIVIEANAHQVLNHRDEPVAMEGTFRDITRRIEAERVLRESEKQYRAFFENNHAIMLLTDPKSERIIDANPAAAEFYGYPIKTMRTMNLSQINALDQDEMFTEMRRSMDEGRAYFILRHRLASGEMRDVEVYSGPIMVQGVQRLYSVIHDVTKRIELEQEMKLLATIDALTGANNRHQFFSLGAVEVQRAKRYDQPLTVLMLDIDYFKSINDSYGHAAGDMVLKALASSVSSILRSSDIFGRLGGEEFAAILPQTDIEEGAEAAGRLRAALAGLTVDVGGDVVSFTVSVGVTRMHSGDSTVEELLNRADEALYKAKRMGRNRVVRG
ncbi:PAS domain S-box protein [Desulfovibrio sp. Huiquan2017]|uniref:sensor domain-containing diguanylate cyclase n=1 Tax=Desulfovibrio sp. Huiquan2017 TaxID=2816861 RepID=UPI001A92E83A|nr:PAS domain S-box protein [Desulfovibrio sp. Huiquan2017]